MLQHTRDGMLWPQGLCTCLCPHGSTGFPPPWPLQVFTSMLSLGLGGGLPGLPPSIAAAPPFLCSPACFLFLFFFFFFFFFFFSSSSSSSSSSSFGCFHGLWKVPGQGLKPHCSCSLHLCRSDAGSLTRCSTGERTSPALLLSLITLSIIHSVLVPQTGVLLTCLLLVSPAKVEAP